MSIVCKSKCNLAEPVTTSNGRETLGDPRRSNFEIDTTTSHNGHAVTGVSNRDRFTFYSSRLEGSTNRVCVYAYLELASRPTEVILRIDEMYRRCAVVVDDNLSRDG